jgi:hypothetical protein
VRLAEVGVERRGVWDGLGPRRFVGRGFGWLGVAGHVVRVILHFSGFGDHGLFLSRGRRRGILHKELKGKQIYVSPACHNYPVEIDILDIDRKNRAILPRKAFNR